MKIIHKSLVFFKSLLFYLFDSIALWNQKKAPQTRAARVLLIRQDAIGDFVLWLDTAKEYRKLYSPCDYHITLLGNALWCDLAETMDYWDEIIPVDSVRFKTFSTYRWNMLRRIHDLGATIAIQPTFSREFYLGDSLLRASNAEEKIASSGNMSNRDFFKKTISDSWCTRLIPSSPQFMTELERNAEFFSGLNKHTHKIAYPKIKFQEISENVTEETHAPFYILFPGASTFWKMWGTNNFSELAIKIYEQTVWEGILCGVESEWNVAEQIKMRSQAPLKNLAGKTSLPEFVELLKSAQILIGNDTSAVHLASAVETPAICILGGGHFGRFAPYPEISGQRTFLKTISHEMACYHCNWECLYPLENNKAAPCVAQISVNDVWNLVKEEIDALTKRD